MPWADLKEHLVQAVATAAILGGGAALIDTKVDLARHDERIARIEKLDESMELLQGELQTTREALARVEERQKQE